MHSRDLIGFIILGIGGIAFVGFLILLLVLWKKQLLSVPEVKRSAPGRRRKSKPYDSAGVTNVAFFPQSTHSVPRINDTSGVMVYRNNPSVSSGKTNRTQTREKPNTQITYKKANTRTIAMGRGKLSDSYDDDNIDFESTFPVELGFVGDSQIHEEAISSLDGAELHVTQPQDVPEIGEVGNALDDGAAGDERGESFSGASTSIVESEFINDNQNNNNISNKTEQIGLHQMENGGDGDVFPKENQRFSKGHATEAEAIQETEEAIEPAFLKSEDVPSALQTYGYDTAALIGECQQLNWDNTTAAEENVSQAASDFTIELAYNGTTRSDLR